MTRETREDELSPAESLFLDFAQSEELPAAAMAEAAAHWRECSDFFLETLRGYAAGDLDPEEDGDAPSILLHLLAQQRDTRAFLPLVALLRQDGEMLEAVFGDTLTETLARILVSVFDGDPTALEDLTADPKADQICRWAAIDAFMGLHLRGRIGMERVIAQLGRIADAGLEPDDSAWIGWMEACALADDPALNGRAREFLASGAVAPDGFGPRDFEAALADRARGETRVLEYTAPIEDAAALLSEWYGYTEAGIAARRKAATLGGSVGTDTHVNPYRGIGRNDPCPCGSGRKFKKCHGA